MTLIIGVKCEDDVVIASDGAATLGSLGNRTVLQPTKKLHIIDNKVIVGVSGQVGLGQRITGEIETMWNGKKLAGKKSHEAMTIVSQGIREHMKQEYDMAQIASRTIGNTALQGAISATLVAIPVNKKTALFEFDHQGSPEEKTKDMPFVAIGSGQSIADPFLAFIRRVFWSDSCCPSLSDAIFAAVWTLQHAIFTNPGGVANPIQVMSLSIDGDDYSVKEYTSDELKEHYELITEIEKGLHDYKASMITDKKAQSIPEPAEV